MTIADFRKYLLSLLTGFILMALPSSTLFAADSVENMLRTAWQAVAENEPVTAMAGFAQVVDKDPLSRSALTGLAYLNSMRNDEDKARHNWFRLMESGPEAYVLNGLYTLAFQNQIGKNDSSLVDLLHHVIHHNAGDGISAAIAHELLGQHYQIRAEFDSAAVHFTRLNALTDWQLCGPFDNISASGFDKVFPPETEYRPGVTYTGQNGVPARWFTAKPYRPDRWLDFRRYFAFENAVFYANTFVYSETDQPVQIRVGMSGSLKLFLNDQPILSHEKEVDTDLDTHIVETGLAAGWNRLLVKCGFSEVDNCNFMLRLTNPHGQPIPGLTFAVEEQKYSTDSVSAELIEDAAVGYFSKLTEVYPDEMPYHLLLADTYLYRDQAENAEIVLNRALERWPDCVLLLSGLISAYERGGKIDEAMATFEKIYTLDPYHYGALQYQFGRELRLQSYEQAGKLLDIMAKHYPDSEYLLRNKVQFYNLKKQTELVRQTAAKAYERYPDNWTFVYAAAMLSIERTKGYDQAIEIMADYLERRFEPTALAALADFYLQDSRVDEWEAAYEQLVHYNPLSPGHHYHMSQVYFELSDYDSAIAAIQKAITICNNSGLFWESLGQYYRAREESTQAIMAYEQALAYEPLNYEIRATLREMKGQGSLLDSFGQANVDSIIRRAPGAVDYPEANGIILYDTAQRVVYPGGASEIRYEMLIKVFDKIGIDDYREYWLGHNPYTEGLIIEESAVYKSNGDQVKADVMGAQVVFKSLEENDIIHLKWRVKKYYSGGLAEHFWDEYYFNFFYPIQYSSYSVLVPEDYAFAYHCSSPNLKPSISTHAEGRIYQWAVTDQSAIQEEYNMPPLGDIGLTLQVSSIPDWAFVVNWYNDLARSKTRRTYEIRELVRKLFPAAETISKTERIQRVYEYITEQIRYSSVPFRQSGLIPQKARDVLVTRIGDCKDMATLGIALLAEVGVEAYYVLVKTYDEGYGFEALPSIEFNHCIAAAESDTGRVYIDLTANHYPFGALPDMNIDGLALLIKPGETKPFRLSAKNNLPRHLKRQTIVTINPDRSLDMTVETMRSGSPTAATRSLYRYLSEADRKKTMGESLGFDFIDAQLSDLSFTNLDSLAPDLTYQYTLHVPDYLTDAGQFLIFNIPWTDGFEADPSLAQEERQQPFVFWNDCDVLQETMVINRPPQFQLLELPASLELTNPVAEYSLKFSQNEDGSLLAERMVVTRNQYISPKDYPAFKSFFSQTVNFDKRPLLLKRD